MRFLLFIVIQFLVIYPALSNDYNFKAIYNENVVELSWINPFHTEIDYFVLEHSKNGRYFSEFITVDGDGKLGINHYDYYEVDNKPFRKKGYYRIKSIDVEGKVYYSEVIFTKNSEIHKSVFSLFNNTNKNIKGFSSKNTLVVLLDANKKEFIAKVDIMEEGNNLMITKTNVSLPTGEYVVCGTSEDLIYGRMLSVDGIYAKTE